MEASAGAHHVDDQGLDHVGAGDLKCRRRPDGTGLGETRSRPSRRDAVLRARSRRGIYPAVDSASIVRLGICSGAASSPTSTRRRHARPAVLQRYKDLQDIIAIWDGGALRRDKVVVSAPPGRALPLEARSSSPSVSQARPGQVRQARGHDARSRGASEGKHDDCRARAGVSTCRATSRMCSRPPELEARRLAA